MTFELSRHGRAHAFTYPPSDHSDHLPMAWLALGALGAPEPRRQAFANAYLPRLSVLADDDPRRLRQQALLTEIGRSGIATVVARYLPEWVTGWYRDAYHPLIRLAYGVEFDVAEEVAAGLAYLEACGSCPLLGALAIRARHDPAASATDLFRRARRLAAPGTGGPFDLRAEAALGHRQVVSLATVVPDNLRSMSRAALAAFAATHDFFALHLVTGSHAFRVVYDYAGQGADAILNLGLLAGYSAIGAPPFEPVPDLPSGPAAASAEQLLALCRDDEHDLKLVYSARQQAAHWEDPAYLQAVEHYLKGAGPTA